MKTQKLVLCLKIWGPLPLVKRHNCPLVFYEGMWGVAGIASPILNLGIKCARVVATRTGSCTRGDES